MRKKAIAGAIAAILAAAIYFVFFAGTDEEKIRGAIERLAKAVQVTADDGNPILKTARVRSELAAVLTDDAHVTVPELGTKQGRDSIAEMAVQGSLAYRSAEVDMHDLQIKLDDAKTTAKVGARAHLRATTRAGEEQRDQRAVDFLLRKTEGRWKIASITVWDK